MRKENNLGRLALNAINCQDSHIKKTQITSPKLSIASPFWKIPNHEGRAAVNWIYYKYANKTLATWCAHMTLYAQNQRLNSKCFRKISTQKVT